MMLEFVLLDVHLSKMDGLQVLKHLREGERTELVVPVILFSSSKEHVLEGYKLGANSYVTKPANFGGFSKALQYLGWFGSTSTKRRKEWSSLWVTSRSSGTPRTSLTVGS